MLKELTCGTFGRFLWFRWCFTVLLDDKQLVIKIPFYRKIIPIDRIEALTSVKGFMWSAHLKLLYRDSVNNVRTVKFFSVYPSDWFDEFERLKIKIEDTGGLRNLKNDKFLQFAKILNLSAGAIAIVVAIVGLIIAFIAIINSR